jgi:hypothetical protein
MQIKSEEEMLFEITFETKCYEKDWEYLLKTDHLDRMISNCHVKFAFRQLIINNVKQPEKVKQYAQQKVDNGIIDAFYFVDDYIDEALAAFDIQKDSFGTGYYYSCSELVGIYVSKTKYHLHFSSDAFMVKNAQSKWIIDACKILEENPEFVTANPTWNYRFAAAKKEVAGKTFGKFYTGYGFSDQCYLIKTEDFKAKIYNYSHPAAERYPKYGGELFEKRVDAFMRTQQRMRLTSINETYIHRNFSKSKFIKSLTLGLLTHDRSIVRFFKTDYYKHLIRQLIHR